MSVEYRRFVPGDADVLAEFLTGEDWPYFAGGPGPGAATVLTWGCPSVICGYHDRVFAGNRAIGFTQVRCSVVLHHLREDRNRERPSR